MTPTTGNTRGKRRRQPMTLTSVFLSDEDRAIVDRLMPVVAGLAGAATLASVIRYALRRAAELDETAQIGPAKRAHRLSKRRAKKKATKRRERTSRRAA